MHSAIANHKEEIAGICRRYNVARLEVFGSAARGTDFDPDRSDADFLVKYRPDSGMSMFGHVRLARVLGDVLGRNVDLVELEAVRNRRLREAINQSREIVYGA